MPTKITADISQLKRTLGILQETLETGLRGAVRRWLIGLARQSFARRASPEGQPWAPLSPAWQRAPKRHGTRAFLRSLFGRIEGKTVEVGSRIPFADAYERGATYAPMVIEPKPGHRALRFFGAGFALSPSIAGGAGAVFRRRLEIPARVLPPRPFLPGPVFAESGAVEIINQQLDEALRNAENA